MDIQTWLAFLAASAVLLMIPGPTVLLVLSYALSQGRRVAVASATGVATGDFVAMTASLAGLGALVLASATLFTVLKWIGAVYLVWMGIKMLLSTRRGGMVLPETGAAVRPATVYREAAVVTALNPKSIAFFIAFVPQFLNPDAPLVPQFAVLVASFVALATLNALAYALAADRLRSALARPAAITWLTRAGGATLVGMGVITATLKRATA